MSDKLTRTKLRLKQMLPKSRRQKDGVTDEELNVLLSAEPDARARDQSGKRRKKCNAGDHPD